MSKTQPKQDEEDDDIYFEACDRILSSSNSSTSNSDSENDASPPSLRRNDDVWISTEFFSLSSIEQRRDRLLRTLGLSSDAVLSRRKSSVSDRSVSFDQLADRRIGTDNSGIFSRSQSDFAQIGAVRSQCNSSTCSILAICSVSHTVNSNNNISNCTRSNNITNNNYIDKIKNNDSCDNLVSNGCFGSGSGLSKLPPNVGKSIRWEVDEIGNVYSGDEKIDRVCRIKNLDNGKEFVVNEVREDGMWNKLREVGTGRQFTMEEFEMSVGCSPIVQELMRRQNVEDQRNNKDNGEANVNGAGNGENGSKLKKKASWFRSIKNVASSVAGYKERRSSDERDTSSEKGGRRSSSATDDSQDTSFNGPERIRVRQYGKSVKDLTALYKSQEIQAHNGSIWTIKFSLDGRYLASAGEDSVIHIWQVVESERKGELLVDGSLNLLFLANGSPEPNSLSPRVESPMERKRRGRTSTSRKSVSLDHIIVPETVFGLSEKPICSFQGHSDDVLDLSWSKSQLLLSSSMDKTVRLWNLYSKTCLKIFSHSDYVTCIQFNPVDDRYFISGSLDAKVRIWSIPDRQVVDWNDLHEMVTAACYTPDGQGALVGSYKGTCRLYNTSENKLQPKGHINLQNKKKKSHLKKITGFQFAPGSSSEVLITSADSRVRVVDGVDLVHKFKGFRNTNSQISASLTANGKYVVCASEDSHVYIWKHEGDSRPTTHRTKSVTVTRTYEHFHCQDVCVAIPWPGGPSDPGGPQHPPYLSEGREGPYSRRSMANHHPPSPVVLIGEDASSASSPLRGTISSATNGYFFDRISATWPEEKLLMAATKNQSHSPRASLEYPNGMIQNRSGWGLVIVTAGIRGEIRIFQNFGLPVRI